VLSDSNSVWDTLDTEYTKRRPNRLAKYKYHCRYFKKLGVWIVWTSSKGDDGSHHSWCKRNN